MAKQALMKQTLRNPLQDRDRVIERVNAWPEWKRNAFSYRVPESPTSAKESVATDQDDCCGSETSK